MPTLVIKSNDVTLFTRNIEGLANISVYNSGSVGATYKWKKLNEEWRYIGVVCIHMQI